nr:hypothetical protein CFP56_67736 [Quercus suber]
MCTVADLRSSIGIRRSKKSPWIEMLMDLCWISEGVNSDQQGMANNASSAASALRFCTLTSSTTYVPFHLSRWVSWAHRRSQDSRPGSKAVADGARNGPHG